MTFKILIVEDDEELQELYATMLAELECRISRAYDGDEALAKIEEDPPDLIVLDILLGQVMGDAVFVQLKGDARYRDIPVIIASVLAANQCQHLLELAPSTHFLRKPFRREDLVRAIERSLGDQ